MCDVRSLVAKPSKKSGNLERVVRAVNGNGAFRSAPPRSGRAPVATVRLACLACVAVVAWLLPEFRGYQAAAPEPVIDEPPAATG